MQIKSTADQIADHIRDAIFSGRYVPGDRLKETEIASWLAVSRTPVRESLHKLEAEGLAESQPNKGVIVPLIDDQDIDEICELRTLIELYCVRKFIRIATERHFEEMENIIRQMKNSLSGKDIPNYFALSLDFHAYYIRHCQNGRMYAFFNSIRNTMRMAQSILGKTDSFYQTSLNEHLEIMSLLKKRSPQCEKALRLHIEDACSRMREKLKGIRD
jgi:DNA-binding GntR family transcriptional regulator